ncbi:MAG: type II secretion system protein J [Phycisphaerales bacterium JB037]
MTITRSNRPLRRRARSAFTLLELIIAIAAGVLIALGLASLFASAGDTVATGRRVSEFNRYASLIERQLREDLEAASREGFLLIRHAVANEGTDNGLVPVKVALTADDPAPRFRRIDELVFFRKGRFASARGALAPGFTADGNAARVYYGHGSRVDLDSPLINNAQFEALRVPEFDLGIVSASADPQDFMGLLGEPDLPNEFASDWTLLRHITVLSRPSAADQRYPIGPWYGLRPDRIGPDRIKMGDMDRQIGLQPAMPSIFRHINFALRTTDPNAPDILRDGAFSNYQREPWMLNASGLIDVATTDLSEIRAYVTSMHQDSLSPAVPTTLVAPQDFADIADVEDLPPQSWMPLLNLGNTDSLDYLYNMHAWMRQALPGDSNGDDDMVNDRLWNIRMRAEPAPPGIDKVLEDAQDDGRNRGEQFETTDRLNDQLILTASNFAPRCTEFIVEWSFGQLDAQGEVIWYGSTQLNDLDNDGIGDEVAISRYGASGQPLLIDRRTGRPVVAGQAPTNPHVVDARLIHGQVNPAPSSTNDFPVLHSYFGYIDPTYPGSAPAPTGSDLPQLPWAWPELIRVTISLADPNDPEFEQTFQFVFEPGKREQAN